ncbi:MAG: fimbria/pilus periplasmic chaperone [Hyphomicrobium sp.]
MQYYRSLILSAIWTFVPAIAVAQAMTVSPMQVEMISAGKYSHAQVSVVNTSDQPLPVEAVIQRLTLDEAGRPKTSKAGEEFLVMPPQAMIPPGATQNFRVQWLGDPMMAQSQSFLLYMNQIPVKLPAGKSGVQVVMSMGVMINVAPPQGTPSMKVVQTGIATDKNGKRFPTITVENTSTIHALLPQATINLVSGNWSSTLTPRSIGDRIGIGLVQPGKRRKFTLPVELPAGVSNIQASLELTK